MPREIRIIGIRGFSKEHLASCDEFGERGHKTLGGVDYDPIHRTGNRPVEKALSGIAWKSRLAAAEGSRVQMRIIVQFLDGTQSPFSGGLLHPTYIVQDSGNRSGGHPRPLFY